MKKILLFLGALVITLSVSAQKPVALDAQVIQKNLSMKPTVYKGASMANQLASQATSLEQNQMYMGASTGDGLDSRSYGYNSYFSDAQLFVGQMLPSDYLDVYTGGKIVGMRAALGADAGECEFSILGVTAAGSVEAVASQVVSTTTKGWNQIALDGSVTIDPSKYQGYIIGYTWAQANSTSPVVFCNDGLAFPVYVLGTYNSKKAFYYVEDAPLAVQLIIEKENGFDANRAELSDFEDIYTMINQEAQIETVLFNVGTAGISSYSYTIARDGVAGEEKTVTLDKPFNTFFYPMYITIPVMGASEDTTEDITLTITKINGGENSTSMNSATAKLNTVKKLFTHRVAVEEYTGTGCGWCPRGWQAMENLREDFGDKFIGIALHQYSNQSSDAMNIAKNKYASVSFSGAPSARVERGAEVDPYYGSDEVDIRNDVRAALKKVAPVGVEVTGTWNEDKTAVDAVASLEANTTDTYTIEYVLVADGLSGTTTGWKQSNYYALYTDPRSQYYQWPVSSLPADLQKFGYGGQYGKSTISGLKFNDVALASSYVSSKNQATKLGTLNAYEPVENSYTISMPTYAKLLEKIDYSKVYIVALVVNSKGQIVNAAKSEVKEAAAAPVVTDLMFVDAKGNAIEDGATIVMSESEEDDFEQTIVPLKGLFVKNTTEEDIDSRLTITVDAINNGMFNCCFGGSCRSLSSAGSLDIPAKDGINIPAGESVEINQTEWIIDDTEQYGTLAVKFALSASDGLDFNNVSTITVNFVYADPAGINDIYVDTDKKAAIYNLNGQRVNGAQKGLYIINGKKVVK